LAKAKQREEVLSRIAEGESLRSICADEGTPSKSTFLKWVSEDAELSDQYARAMERRADSLFDEMFAIADDASNDWVEREGDDGEGYRLNGEHVQRSRLRIDTRKWALARMNPKKYGEKQEIHNKHDVADPLAALLTSIAGNGKRIGDG
jgi:hypothetical protein